jgi:hypothetical protein
MLAEIIAVVIVLCISHVTKAEPCRRWTLNLIEVLNGELTLCRSAEGHMSRTG